MARYRCSYDGSIDVTMRADGPEEAAKAFAAQAQAEGHDIRWEDVDVAEAED